MIGEITNDTYPDEALFYMKNRPPNADGSIGLTITPAMPEWAAWYCYFLGKRMDQRASFMNSRAMSGYMVPCSRPEDFDPNGIAEARQHYAWRRHNGEVPSPGTTKPSSMMTASERQDVLDRLAKLHPDLFGKFARTAMMEAAE